MGFILKNSLSKQNKFCAEWFGLQKTKTNRNAEIAELRLWQDQLLEIIKEDQMDDQKIIYLGYRKAGK